MWWAATSGHQLASLVPEGLPHQMDRQEPPSIILTAYNLKQAFNLKPHTLQICFWLLSTMRMRRPSVWEQPAFNICETLVAVSETKSQATLLSWLQCGIRMCSHSHDFSQSPSFQQHLSFLPNYKSDLFCKLYLSSKFHSLYNSKPQVRPHSKDGQLRSENPYACFPRFES